MQKTIAGITLVSGLLTVGIGAAIGQIPVDNTPQNDWLADLLSWAGLGVGLLGVVMFFVGALVFARR